MNREELWKKLAEAIANGDEVAASEVAQQVLAAGLDPIEAIQHAAVKGLDVVGGKYQRLEAFLPELVLAGDAMKACMAVLVPHIKKDRLGEISLGKVVIGTVSGDIHDIGKNLVGGMLAITGFDVHDLGVNVPPRQFIEKAEEVKAKAIALSALLATAANYQEQVIKNLKDAGLREKYYVVVGGGPITPEWAAKIGADGYARTSVGASELLKKLITGGTPPPLSQPLVIRN